MSRQLPENPNFEFLQKEAKELRRTMQQGKLAEAQHQLAREYGFATWAKLKAHVEELRRTPAEALKAAVCDSDSAKVSELLAKHKELRAHINEPMPGYGFGANAMFAAVQRSDRETIDVLLRAGADINRRTDWWAGSFGVMDDCDASLVGFLMERGAVMDAHAAARLGRLDRLRELVAADANVVHARGGDGQTPLHFASTVEVAEFLLAHGADIDALDVDHESTPAQYMQRWDQKRQFPMDRQVVARYLVSRGCKTEILMASALGDLELVRRHLDRDAGCIRMTVSQAWFPMKNPRAGGTIYRWTLGENVSPHVVARNFGHEDVFALLMERTPEDLKMALACELGDEAAFRELLRRNPDFANSLSETDKVKLPNAAKNNNTQAVRLMLEAGWPVNTPGEAGATALHWAGFNGNSEMARVILKFGPELEKKSQEYSDSAFGWTVYGSGNGWHRDDGDYVGVVQALRAAGAKVPENAVKLEPSEAVLEELGLGG